MKYHSGWVGGAVGLGLSIVVRRWMRTLRYQMSYYDPSRDPVCPDFKQPGIYVFWHEYIPFMFYLRGHNRVAMLLSQHRDAESLARATRFVGFETVRGSTKRGGVQAIREMMRRSQTTNLTLTPDGPRGPRRQLASGCIYMASRLQMPIVPLGLGYDRPWRMTSAWDQFAIPRPGSAARAIMGPPLMVPPKANRETMEVYRRIVESNLNELTSAAENWAESGIAYGDPIVVRREPEAMSWRRTADVKSIGAADDWTASSGPSTLRFSA